jgi:DNA invertase Pin-like site-specific DNA recombinase
VKLVAYVRVSTDKQVRDGYGLAAQRSDIKAWAQREGHRVVRWCADEGISGANGITTREGLYDALNELRDGRAQGMVFTSLDRLARKMTEQEGVLAEVWRVGGRVFSLGDGGEVLEDDPDDPMRTAIRQMRGVFAQLERGLIRQRMAKGKREKAARGGYVGGAPHFGAAAVDGRLIVDEAEAAVARRIIALHHSGHSLRRIIEVLDAEELKPRRGRWHPTSIGRIIERAAK